MAKNKKSTPKNSNSVKPILEDVNLELITFPVKTYNENGDEEETTYFVENPEVLAKIYSLVITYGSPEN